MSTLHEESRALGELADQAGFSLSDVAFISGLDESTISRLWNDRAWLDRVTGTSLQKLVASVPGVGSYVMEHSIAARLASTVAQLEREDLCVREEGLAAAVASGIPEPYIANALEAALRAMQRNIPDLVSYLARFWGKDQNLALERLYSRQPEIGLFRDPDPLLAVSTDLAPNLGRKAYSFHAIVAEATIAHHVRLATGAPAPPVLPATVDRKTAFTYRSSVMGLLIEGNDFDLAARYDYEVGQHSTMAMIEDWAMPTFTRDVRPNGDFALPRSVLLRNTAEEIIREIERFNDAYVQYLLVTYLPRALRREPTLGLSLERVRSAILRRLDRTDDINLRRMCEHTARTMERNLA